MYNISIFNVYTAARFMPVIFVHNKNRSPNINYNFLLISDNFMQQKNVLRSQKSDKLVCTSKRPPFALLKRKLIE